MGGRGSHDAFPEELLPLGFEPSPSRQEGNHFGNGGESSLSFLFLRNVQ